MKYRVDRMIKLCLNYHVLSGVCNSVYAKVKINERTEIYGK
jgi:hypothetical protein